jgi:hypothetical protein
MHPRNCHTVTGFAPHAFVRTNSAGPEGGAPRRSRAGNPENRARSELPRRAQKSAAEGNAQRRTALAAFGKAENPPG